MILSTCSSVQSGAVPLPMSVGGWPGGLSAMGYGWVYYTMCTLLSVGLFSVVFNSTYFGEMTVLISRYMAPLQGVVSMDGSTVSSAPIQVCHFPLLFFKVFPFSLSKLFGASWFLLSKYTV